MSVNLNEMIQLIDETIKYGGFALTLIIAIIVVYNCFKDRRKIIFRDRFFVDDVNGESVVTKVSVSILYRGKGSMYIEKIGFAYRDNVADIQEIVIHSPGAIISESSPFSHTQVLRDEQRNLKIMRAFRNGHYAYFITRDTGKRCWQYKGWERFNRLGRFYD